MNSTSTKKTILIGLLLLTILFGPCVLYDYHPFSNRWMYLLLGILWISLVELLWVALMWIKYEEDYLANMLVEEDKEDDEDNFQ